MNYPLISEYIESIKSAEDNFDELSYLMPVLDKQGLPVMCAGGFSVVFKMKDEKNHYYAVKCFTKEQAGRNESYKLIADELEFLSSNYLIPIKFLEKELFVDTSQTTDTEFPVLLMDWVEGIPMDKYINEKANDQFALEMLAFRFSKLSTWLLAQPFAHGDLKPDNILVKEDGSIVLVDYDGMYVPAMKGQKARELGSPNFRHPTRAEVFFDERIDDFAISLILLSLKAFSLNHELIHTYCTSDSLLFKIEDYTNLYSCEAMMSMVNISHDIELNILIGVFLIAYSKGNLECVLPQLLNLKNPKSGIAYGKYLYEQARSFCKDAKDKSKIDYGKAYELFKQSARMGNPDAQCCLGCCYKHGYGVPVNYGEARVWYNKSSQSGCARALRHIGMCHEDGIGVEKNIYQAMEWYRKAFEQGDGTSAEILGKIYYYGRGGITINYEEAVKWYSMAADMGNSDGMWRLGSCYKYGNGLMKDYHKATDYYLKASEKGNSEGQWRLGICYLYGEGVEKNYQTAVKWFEKAADNGDYEGQWRLGHCYEYGIGVDKNLNLAFEFYKQASEKGSSEGQWRLGQCYRYARGVEKNIKEALIWYKKAADQGHKKAENAYQWLNRTSEIYNDGCYHIQNKSYEKAYNIFRSISMDPYGQNGIAFCYAYGFFVEKNLDKASYWFLKAARQGLSIAQFNIGNCYYHGKGVTEDTNQAYYWYKRAEEQGLLIARAMITYTGTGAPFMKQDEDLQNVERWNRISNNFILNPPENFS